METRLCILAHWLKICEDLVSWGVKSERQAYRYVDDTRTVLNIPSSRAFSDKMAEALSPFNSYYDLNGPYFGCLTHLIRLFRRRVRWSWVLVVHRNSLGPNSYVHGIWTVVVNNILMAKGATVCNLAMQKWGNVLFIQLFRISSESFSHSYGSCTINLKSLKPHNLTFKHAETHYASNTPLTSAYFIHSIWLLV